MLQCEIIKFQAQDIITSSIAVIEAPENPCQCWSAKQGKHICRVDNGRHIWKTVYYDDGAKGEWSCTSTEHSCGN